jgi:hypothetical protein
VLGVLQHFLGRPGLDNPAQVHDGYPVREGPGEPEIVGYDQRGQPQCVPQVRDKQQDFPSHGGVQRGHRLVGRFGPRWPMISGLVLAGATMLGLLRIGTRTPVTATWWDFALAGAGSGLCLTPMTQVAVSAVGAGRAGMASAVHNALRQFGQVLGVAVLGALVYARASASGRLAGTQAAAFLRGLHAAMLLSGAVLLAAAGLVAFALRGSPRSARGKLP